jgi:hypothetical protein
MIVEDYIIEEVRDTLRQSRLAILGITALDSSAQMYKKEIENDCSVVRRINKCQELLDTIMDMTLKK